MLARPLVWFTGHGRFVQRFAINGRISKATDTWRIPLAKRYQTGSALHSRFKGAGTPSYDHARPPTNYIRLSYQFLCIIALHNRAAISWQRATRRLPPTPTTFTVLAFRLNDLQLDENFLKRRSVLESAVPPRTQLHIRNSTTQFNNQLHARLWELVHHTWFCPPLPGISGRTKSSHLMWVSNPHNILPRALRPLMVWF